MKKELIALIDRIWAESNYRFDRQAAVDKLVQIINHSDQCDIVSNMPKDNNIFTDIPKTIAGLLQAVCLFYEIDVDEVKSMCRHSELVDARNVYYFIARKTWPKYQLKYIGSLVEKHYSTVIHGIKTVERDIKLQKGYRDTLITTSRIIGFPLV